MNGYAVRGIVDMVKSGHIEADEAQEILDAIIEDACQRGYREGIRDCAQSALTASRTRAKDGASIIYPERGNVALTGL